jgi:S-adenosylmethionine:tRNA ribosyltransferase-isomerase
MHKVDRKGKSIKDEEGNKILLTFADILDFFDEGDTFVFNDTKVMPARLYSRKEKTDAKIEVFLLRELNADMRLWDVLVEPARKIRIGNKLFFDDETLVAEVIDNTTSRGRTLRFLHDYSHDEFKRRLYALGQPPLPRYVMDLRAKESKKNHIDIEESPEDFQCIYASNEGAVTAPSTGLHFTRQMMKRIDINGINTAFVTLHCGLSNFQIIDVEDLSKHKPESEEMYVNAETCKLVNDTKRNGHRVCAIGASTLKALESCVGTDGFIKEYRGWTSKFIYPPYDFGSADAFLTNFYHPMSPMMMEACAFGGFEPVMTAYKQALKAGYKFGCFGDALLII